MIATLAVDALVVALLLGLTAMATVLLRRRSAAERHWLLAASAAAALLVPAIRATVPDRFAVAVPWPTTAAAIQSQVTPTPSDGGDVTAWFEVALPAPATTPTPITVLPWLWLAGVGLAGGRLTAALTRLRVIARDATPVEDGIWRSLCDELCRTLGLATPVRLLHSADPSLLATWGWRRPVIVVPTQRWRGRRTGCGSCSPTSWRTSPATIGDVSCSARCFAPCTGSTRWPGECAGSFAPKASGPATTRCSPSGFRRRSSPITS
jgi:hypothetical protein